MGVESLLTPLGRHAVRQFHCRTAFISDVHLGTQNCQAAYLLDFLDNLRADTLYLVGDIVDLQSLKRRLYWPASHGAIVEKLLSLSQNGTRVIYIPGNHDDVARRYVNQTLAGIEVRMSAVHETARGERLLVTHGDEFDTVVRCGNRMQWLGDFFYQGLLGCNRLVNRLRRLTGRPYWSLAGFVKSRVSTAGKYIRRFEAAAARRARNEGFDGCVCGHIHVAALRTIGETLYINDGDWVEHCTAAIEDHKGNLQLMHWTEQRTVLVLHTSRPGASDVRAA